jgi:hypothetical protein
MEDIRDSLTAPDTLVARGKKHGQATNACLLELSIARLHELRRGLLSFIITIAYRVYKGCIRVSIDCLCPIKKRVSEHIESSKRDRSGDGLDVLNIEKCLYTGLASPGNLVINLDLINIASTFEICEID